MPGKKLIAILNRDGAYIRYPGEVKPMSLWARFRKWYRRFIDKINRALRGSNKAAAEAIEKEMEEELSFARVDYKELEPIKELEEEGPTRYKTQYVLYYKPGEKAEPEVLGTWEHTFGSDTDYYKDGHPALKFIDNTPSPDENPNAEPSAYKSGLRVSPEVFKNVIGYCHSKLKLNSFSTSPAKSSEESSYSPIDYIKFAEELHFYVMASGVMEGNNVKQLNEVIEIYNGIYSKYNNLVKQENDQRHENKGPGYQYIGEEQEKDFIKAQAIHSDLKCMLEYAKTKIPAAKHVRLKKLVDISTFVPYEDWLGYGAQELTETVTEELPELPDTWGDELLEDFKTPGETLGEDEAIGDIGDVASSYNIEQTRSALKGFYTLGSVASFSANILNENISLLQIILSRYEAFRNYNDALDRLVAEKSSQESIGGFISIAQDVCKQARDPQVIEQGKGAELINEVCRILSLESLADSCLELNNESEIDHVYNEYEGFAKAAGLEDGNIQRARAMFDACKEVIAFGQQEFTGLSALHSRYQKVREKTSAIFKEDYGIDNIWAPYLDGISMALKKLENMSEQITAQDPCLTKFMHDSDVADKTGDGFMKWMFGVESTEEIKRDCPDHAGRIDKIAEALDKAIQVLSEEQSRDVTRV
ncbi:hypothetical protein RLOatenuis_7350 [Rickettsiales bacterium]|nr:hypothetical protein RLOatenuis_7350 [Rickettsiales bacterium]